MSLDPRLDAKNPCILHADFHKMSDECWRAVISFMLEHPELHGEKLYDLYDLMYERKLMSLVTVPQLKR